MNIFIAKNRLFNKADKMLYGHFIEHFHRQIYRGVYDPSSKFADEDGFRTDVMDAMRQIKVPILRWPGGCFVSSYNWKKAIGPNRIPFFDKSWRVEDPNTFGTDEFIKLCRKVSCEPYICTNAGTGTAEEMSDWVEYCNLKSEGEYARMRIANGYTEPYNVKYWSVGNENYGEWEIGAKNSNEWGHLVNEAAKMMLRVSPSIEISAAALADTDWNLQLLKKCSSRMNWISIHQYWDGLWQDYNPSNYTAVIGMTNNVGQSIREIRGILNSLNLQNSIRIAFDEWNLRSWHHPNTQLIRPSEDKSEYLLTRDLNDTNSTYTIADAVFSACFLNECLRNCDIVGMANFAPLINTCGAIFTHKDGIVKRSTYHVFDLFANQMGENVIDLWIEEAIIETVSGAQINMLDMAAAVRSKDGAITISAVNKYDSQKVDFYPVFDDFTPSKYEVFTILGASTDSYNDIDKSDVTIEKTEVVLSSNDRISIELLPHSVNIIVFSS